MDHMFHRHPFLSVVTFAYLGVVGYVTLGPQPIDNNDSDLIFRVLDVLSRHEKTQWITYERVEFGANIAMFIPVGLFFLLLLGRGQWWLAIILGFAMTVAIETAQTSIPGRVSDERDIVANTAGAVIGVLGGLILTFGSARRRRQRQRDRAYANSYH
ncbi:hypothetical protein BH09ACT10_BH09ACT10_06020 [soil metagenome]